MSKADRVCSLYKEKQKTPPVIEVGYHPNKYQEQVEGEK